MSERNTSQADPRTYGRELTGDDLDQLIVNTIRALAMDGVQKAKSGHPGMPMGMADAAYVLWTRFLRHSPADPDWADRDRFLLSAGHGSMLLYSLLHLFGYDMQMEDLMQFRQWESRTPGHPEYRCAPGVETTTGPLGQGFANGVGLALAERMLAAHFNCDGEEPLVDHYVYAICSDGDIMEGISHEAAAIAGHLGLGRIIYLYDDNHITIEGSTDLAMSEDVGRRFEAYHWHVQRIDGHHRTAVAASIEAARAETQRPSIIICRTHIAKGSPNKQDTAESHGAPLGDEEVQLTKQALGFPTAPLFFLPDIVKETLAARRQELDAQAESWKQRFARWRRAHPDLAKLWDARMSGALPAGLAQRLPSFETGKAVATRNASGEILQVLSAELPALAGGSADLHPSTKTFIKNEEAVRKGAYRGRNLHFGVREHAMGGILNGMAVHGGFLPYGGTFFVFSDYMRPSVRLAALSGIQVIYVWTHDTVFVGEDGPTHEPVEHHSAIRAIPNLDVIRPADAAETTVAWMMALERTDGPTALLLTRQNVPVLDRTVLPPADMLRKGGYVMLDAEDPEIILIATGSEVHITLDAARLLSAEGRRLRVVNLGCWEVFDRQPEAYREQVLPASVTRRLAVEAASSFGWERYVGAGGAVLGIDRYGFSAPWKVIAEKLGYTPEGIADRARRLLSES
ncbi:MAG TPA: transketolase [Armatimonadota bacterium]|nr:transketolase [Armatimonadota bacterium]